MKNFEKFTRPAAVVAASLAGANVAQADNFFNIDENTKSCVVGVVGSTESYRAPGGELNTTGATVFGACKAGEKIVIGANLRGAEQQLTVPGYSASRTTTGGGAYAKFYTSIFGGAGQARITAGVDTTMAKGLENSTTVYGKAEVEARIARLSADTNLVAGGSGTLTNNNYGNVEGYTGIVHTAGASRYGVGFIVGNDFTENGGIGYYGAQVKAEVGLGDNWTLFGDAGYAQTIDTEESKVKANIGLAKKFGSTDSK